MAKINLCHGCGSKFYRARIETENRGHGLIEYFGYCPKCGSDYLEQIEVQDDVEVRTKEEIEMDEAQAMEDEMMAMFDYYYPREYSWEI